VRKKSLVLGGRVRREYLKNEKIRRAQKSNGKEWDRRIKTIWGYKKSVRKVLLKKVSLDPTAKHLRTTVKHRFWKREREICLHDKQAAPGTTRRYKSRVPRETGKGSHGTCGNSVIKMVRVRGKVLEGENLAGRKKCEGKKARQKRNIARITAHVYASKKVKEESYIK